jgi:hypothetical protein
VTKREAADGLLVYRYDEVVITLTPGKEKVRVQDRLPATVALIGSCYWRVIRTGTTIFASFIYVFLSCLTIRQELLPTTF